MQEVGIDQSVIGIVCSIVPGSLDFPSSSDVVARRCGIIIMVFMPISAWCCISLQCCCGCDDIVR